MPFRRMSCWLQSCVPLACRCAACYVLLAALLRTARRQLVPACSLIRKVAEQVMDKSLFGKGGSSDPFVELKCGAEKAKSKVIKKTLSPDWKAEVLSIPMLETGDPESEVVLTVFDWDMVGKNDFMGRTSVTLGELLAAANAEEDEPDDSDIEDEADGGGGGDGGGSEHDQEQGSLLEAEVGGGGAGRRRKAVLLNEDGMEDDKPLGRLTYSVRWVHNAKIAEERRQQLADVQGELLFRVEVERLPQTADEAASQHGGVLKLLDAEGPQWAVSVPIVATLPPPVTSKVEIAVRYVTKSSTAMGGIAYIEHEGTLFFALGPRRPTQTLFATPKLLHDPLRFERDFDAKGDEHFFLRIVGAKILSVKGGVHAEQQQQLVISEGRRTSTIVIDGARAAPASAAALLPADANAAAPARLQGGGVEEDLRLKAARDASAKWVPFFGGESTCSRCGRVAREHLDGVVWPECVAEHGPPFVYLRRPRVDTLHSSALAPMQLRRHQMAWLSRPVLALHREGKAALQRTRRRERMSQKARQQARSTGPGGAKRMLEQRSARAEARSERNLGGWDASPAGVSHIPRPVRGSVPREQSGRSIDRSSGRVGGIGIGGGGRVVRVSTSLPELPEMALSRGFREAKQRG